MAEHSASRTRLATRFGRALPAAGVWGLFAGVAVSIPATAMDWHANPSGLFRGPDGSHWPVVLETAWSWFWPVACAVAAVVAPMKAWRPGRARPG